MDAWTGYLSEFTHVTESGTRMEDLTTSMATIPATSSRITSSRSGVVEEEEPLQLGLRWRPVESAVHRSLVVAEELHPHGRQPRVRVNPQSLAQVLLRCTSDPTYVGDAARREM